MLRRLKPERVAVLAAAQDATTPAGFIRVIGQPGC